MYFPSQEHFDSNESSFSNGKKKKNQHKFLNQPHEKKPQPISFAVHHSHGPHCTELFKVKLLQ